MNASAASLDAAPMTARHASRSSRSCRSPSDVPTGNHEVVGFEHELGPRGRERLVATDDRDDRRAGARSQPTRPDRVSRLGRDRANADPVDRDAFQPLHARDRLAHRAAAE